jgi:hypothetical protein
MKLYIFLLTLVSGVLKAEITYCEKLKNEGWNSTFGFDDFEGESKSDIAKNIFDKEGNMIGVINFSGIGKSTGPTYIRLSMHRFDPTWPACDYEFAKYKIDDLPSEYFQKRGHACPLLVAYQDFFNALKAGNKLYVSVKNRTGVIDLKGFTHIYNETLAAVKKGKCINK